MTKYYENMKTILNSGKLQKIFGKPYNKNWENQKKHEKI